MSAVAVVGLGKLGAVMAAVLADKGHQVVGVDLHDKTVEKVNTGIAPVLETGLQELYNRAAFNLTATTDMAEAVKMTSIAFIIVPTPSDETGAFTNRYVLDAITKIGAALKDDSAWYTIVVCSTVMPGSCEGIITETLENVSGRRVGLSVGLCYSPEFIALGSVIHDMTHPDTVLMGVSDSRSQSALYDVLSTVPRTEPVWFRMNLVDAELAKIALNTYITMKISFANTIGEICQELPGANADWVTAAIGADSRVGSKYLKPGGAYGGPCFPRDTVAFAKMATDLGVEANLATAADTVNQRQAEQLANQLADCDSVTILGLSYKPNTSVTERSFGMDLLQLLQFRGVVVTTYDPAVRQPVNGHHVAQMLTEAIAVNDVIVVATPWDEFRKGDYTGKRVIDMWGIVPDKFAPERFGRG